MMINAFGDSNLSNVDNSSKNSASQSSGSSLFNSLISESMDTLKTNAKPSPQAIASLATLSKQVEEDLSNIDQLEVDTQANNTHDALTLMLKLRNQYAS